MPSLWREVDSDFRLHNGIALRSPFPVLIGSLPFFRVLLILLWIGIFPAAGNLARIDYSDGTPAVVIQERDQHDWVRRLTDAAGERTLNFDASKGSRRGTSPD